MHSRIVTCAVLVALGLGGGAAAQEHHHHGGAAASGLPEACLARAGDAAPMHMPEMAMPEGLDEAHRALGAGMGQMHADMAMGLLPEDVDVAFVCSMLPHHQGAVDMAKAELEHGDDPQARALAQQIIETQEREIAEMLAWLDGLPAAD